MKALRDPGDLPSRSCFSNVLATLILEFFGSNDASELRRFVLWCWGANPWPYQRRLVG